MVYEKSKGNYRTLFPDIKDGQILHNLPCRITLNVALPTADETNTYVATFIADGQKLGSCLIPPKQKSCIMDPVLKDKGWDWQFHKSGIGRLTVEIAKEMRDNATPKSK